MLNTIKSLLSDCNYEYMETIIITSTDKEHSLSIFMGKLVENQVFLVLSILESDLLEEKIKDELVIDIANAFRNTEIYESDMDKNISLVYCVEKDVNSPHLTKKKVEIEDDPYYFKKYVFSYSKADVEKFEQLCKQYGKTETTFIQNYILNTDNFSKFKINYENENVYRMISDLVIKFPMIPISFEEQEEIKTVEGYMKEIKVCSDNEIEKLDCIIDSISKIEITNTDELLGKIFDVWEVNGNEQ